MKKRIPLSATMVLLLSWNMAAAVTVYDFSTDDNGDPLANGQRITNQFDNLFHVSGTEGFDVAIFDTTPGGPNAANAVALQNDDMLVNRGNALIIQHKPLSTQTVPGIFDTPKDNTSGGTITFDFVSPTQLLSIDLIDVDAPDGRSVQLTDVNGRMRTYTVPNGWTNDLRNAPNGHAALDLTTLADQAGETAVLASAAEDAGFNSLLVSQLSVAMSGSGGIDHLVVVPEPTGIVCIVLALFGMVARKRRR